MKTLRIAIERLAGCAPVGPIVSADTMASMSDAAVMLDAARADAEACRQAAQAALASAQAEAQHIREAARLAGEVDARDTIEAARVAAVDAAVAWLVEEVTLEQAVVASLDKRIREAMAHALAVFVEQQDQTAMLARRIARSVPGLVADGALTVRAHPTRADSVSAAFASCTALRVIPDVRLAPAQARIESPLATICIDVDADLSRIQAYFQTEPTLDFAYG